MLILLWKALNADYSAVWIRRLTASIVNFRVLPDIDDGGKGPNCATNRLYLIPNSTPNLTPVQTLLRTLRIRHSCRVARDNPIPHTTIIRIKPLRRTGKNSKFVCHTRLHSYFTYTSKQNYTEDFAQNPAENYTLKPTSGTIENYPTNRTNNQTEIHEKYTKTELECVFLGEN